MGRDASGGGSSQRKKAKCDASEAPAKAAAAEEAAAAKAAAAKEAAQADKAAAKAAPTFKDGLPPAKTPYEQLLRDVSQAMDDRGTSQTELCRSLSLSPVSMSLWRRNKPLSPRTRDLYSAALELWLADPNFVLTDPKLTNTPPNSVRRVATARLVSAPLPTKPPGRALVHLPPCTFHRAPSPCTFHALPTHLTCTS